MHKPRSNFSVEDEVAGMFGINDLAFSILACRFGKDNIALIDFFAVAVYGTGELANGSGAYNSYFIFVKFNCDFTI